MNKQVVDSLYDVLVAEINEIKNAVRASPIGESGIAEVIGIYDAALQCIDTMRGITVDYALTAGMLKSYIARVRDDKVLIATGKVAKKDLPN